MALQFERRCEFSELRGDKSPAVSKWRCSLRDAANFQSCEVTKALLLANGAAVSAFETGTADLAQLLTLGTLANSWSFIFGDSNWTLCDVTYPVGTLKPDIQMWSFLIWDCFFLNYAFIFSESKHVEYTKTMYSQTGKNTKWAETFIWCLLLIFNLYAGILWHSYLLPFAWDFTEKGQQLVRGQVG